MSRGKKVIFSGLALLGLSSFLVCAQPANAAITTSSTTAAGVDNLAPGPVGEVVVTPDLAGPSVAIDWTLAADDFSRQAPASSNFSSGGVFINVNDVAGYNVWRQVVGDAEATLIAELGAGQTAYVDESVTSGVNYTYLVTAIDGSGNESDAVESEAVSLGPPPEVVTTPPEAAIIAQTVTISFDAVLDFEDEAAVEEFENNLIAELAALLGIDPDRIIIKSVTPGSVVVEFDIADDPDDPASEVVAELITALADDPNALSNVAPVLSSAAFSTVSLDLGTVGLDGLASETFSFSNNPDDPEAVLTVSASVEGAGFSADPATITLAAGESGDINVIFDAAAVGNLNGSYTGLLTITTNDPNNRNTFIDLSALVEGGLDVAKIVVSGAFNFGTVTIGTDKTITLNIANDGDLDLMGSLAVDGDAAFTTDTSDFVLAGGEDTDVAVTFAPTAASAVSATIVIASNDENTPEISVALSGAGRDPGDVQILVDDDGNEIFGDFDGSADVTFDDFFIFADNFGQASFDATTDMDSDGDVDFDDFFIFADNFGLSGTYVGGATATSFSATIDATQASTTSAGSGSGSFTLNAAKTELSYSISATGLADLTAAHLHNAAAGSSGGVARTLSFTTDDNVTWTASGTWTSSEADQPLTTALVAELEAGNIYVNVHTTAEAAGEIRGQVISQ